MGSQTLEILRQGVMASFTGGYFYDPHQNVFCNTIHLYIWLFLLCTPFVTYLYFTTTFTTWTVYCVLVSILVSVLKVVNYSLHGMYDRKAQSFADSLGGGSTKKTTTNLRETEGDEEAGIEMQVLGTAADLSSRVSVERQSDEVSCGNSALSFDFQEPATSTMDFKVDVHRKNSSDSDSNFYPKSALQSSVVTHCAEVCNNNNTNSSHNQPSSSGTTSNSKKGSNNTNQNDKGNNANSATSSSGNRALGETSKSVKKTKSLDQTTEPSECDDVKRSLSRMNSKEKNSKKRRLNTRLQRQVSLDTEELRMGSNTFDEERTSSKLQRYRSTDSTSIEESSRNQSNMSLGVMNPSSSVGQYRYQNRPHGHLQSLASYLYLETNYTTKSELAIENIPSGKLFLMQPATPMRKDSNSTMSAIQLPIATSSMAQSATSRIRRLPNVKGNVRRIKSAALETCPQPYSSYLATQPNSVEAIGGRNPVLPPPSKSLSRNPHLNLYPKNSSHSSVTEPPYPIAEQEGDEIVSSRAINHALLNINLSSDTESEDGDDEEAGGEDTGDNKKLPETTKKRELRMRIRIIKEPKKSESSEGDEDVELDPNEEERDEDGANACALRVPNLVETPDDIEDFEILKSESKKTNNNDLQIMTGSTDSDTENNGSQSPLLDSRPVHHHHHHHHHSSSLGNTSNSSSSKNQIVIIESSGKTAGPMSRGGSSKITGDSKLVVGSAGPTLKRIGRIPKGAPRPKQKNSSSAVNKSEDSGCPSSDWEQVSASSKDMLLTSSKGAEGWFIANPRTEEPNLENLTKEKGKMESSKKIKSLNNDEEDNDEEEAEGEEEDDDDQIVYTPMRNLGAIPKSKSTRISPSRRLSSDEFPLDTLHITSARVPLSQTIISQPVLTFFRTPRAEQPTPSSFLEYQVPNLSPFSMRTYSVVESNFRNNLPRRTSRSRRQPSFEVQVSLKDDGENPTNISGSAGGIESDFGSGTLGGSIDNSYTLQRIFGCLVDQHPVQPQTTIRGFDYDFEELKLMDFKKFEETFKQKSPKKYYKFPIKCCGWKKEVKISMDRLQLMALFDRDTGWFQVILAIVLTALVSVLGSVILQMGFYEDILAFVFCVVIAGSQYSLLKSVQPDAASPIHGFNKTVAYSRPIYFCLCAGLLLGINSLWNESKSNDQVSIFGVNFMVQEFYDLTRYILSLMLLFFPVLFSLGLFPQINTFCMYILEQVDMHIFGGNAICGLVAAIIAVNKSIIACFILYGLAFGGLIEPRGTQHISFSIFCALLIPIAFHLSRCASDFSNVWTLIKSGLVMIHSDDDVSEKSKPIDDSSNEVSESAEATKDKETDRSSTIRKRLSLDGNMGGNASTKPEELKSKSSASLQPFAQSTANSKMSLETENNQNNNSSISAIPNDESGSNSNGESSLTNIIDPLPKKLQKTVNGRLKNDLMTCCVLPIIIFGLHCSTIFTVLQPEVNHVLHALAIVLGFILHYIIPQMRKHWPWLCISKPILKQAEYGQFEPKEATKVMWFESTYVYLCFLERNVLYPIVFLSALTADSSAIVQKFGITLGTLVVVVCGLKCVRNSYSDPASQYLIVIFTVLFFRLDFSAASETFLVDYFFVSIIYRKICDFLLKLQFIVTYIAPWQITWGSAFHAFAQPFSVPHSAMLFVQAGISALLSTPLNPFLGSAIFVTSYVRPIKFWERDYNTRRIDHSNTRLSSQLERDQGADDNNLNSIFYEHLTRSLQHSLCGDLVMGRWGHVSQGDCFVLASDYLNCLVHIIELGNGLCTFQMRGLEFRGTYCQQREVEAISEGIEENRDCCCCSPGHIANMLSVNAMFSTRWLAWQVIASQYVLEGYSISDNSAIATLQVFEFRRSLITYYVKSVIYYTIRSPKLEDWLQSEVIQDALQMTVERQFVDLDPVFNQHLDEDYDIRSSGITRNGFCAIYLDWIRHCYEVRFQSKKTSEKKGDTERKEPAAGNDKENVRPNVDVPTGNFEVMEKPLVSLCLALALLARRTLATASHSSSSSVEFFLHGLHALFKGDFRITSPRDEWVFADMDLLHSVVAPAVRMSLKLHQDHFLNPEQYEDQVHLYTAISTHSQEYVISHEADPLWRNAVLRGVPNMLALRHVMEDGSDEYRIIRLTKRFLSFRVIKLNRECVRGLWSGQQQELIYLRNRNPERGSIQNAKQALRNIINSSCDQPIGYPIYVSPLTTSYAETNQQLCSIIGGSLSFEKIKLMIFDMCRRIRQRCQEGCSSGSTLDCEIGDMQGVYCSPTNPNNTLNTAATHSYGSQSLSASANRGSLASMGKPNSSTLLAGFLNRERDMERESMRDGRSGGSKQVQAPTTKRPEMSRNERRATLPATTTNLSRDMTSKSEMIMMVNMGSTSTAASGNYMAKEGGTESVSNLTTPAGNFMSVNAPRGTNLKSLSFECKRTLPEREERLTVSGALTGHSEMSLFSTPGISLNRKVIIVDAGEIYDCLDLGRRIDVIWPNEEMRSSGGRSSWRDWTPQEGMVGFVVHYWQPNHADSHFRSNVNRTLLLIQIGDHYVPVGENGVKEYYTSAQTMSAENLLRLSRRGKSKAKKSMESVKKVKTEDEEYVPEVEPETAQKDKKGKESDKVESEVIDKEVEPMAEEEETNSGSEENLESGGSDDTQEGAKSNPNKSVTLD